MYSLANFNWGLSILCLWRIQVIIFSENGFPVAPMSPCLFITAAVFLSSPYCRVSSLTFSTMAWGYLVLSAALGGKLTWICWSGPACHLTWRKRVFVCRSLVIVISLINRRTMRFLSLTLVVLDQRVGISLARVMISFLLVLLVFMSEDGHFF